MTKQERTPPTRERVMQLFTYNRATGVFRWRANRTCGNGRVIARRGDVAGTYNRKNGWVLNVDGVQFKAHMLAWLIVNGEWPKFILDHKDGDKRNNAIRNLRPATIRLNAQNMRRAMVTNKSSGLLGVSAQRGSRINPWKAQIRIDGKITHLGSFPTAQKAHLAYVHAKRIHHEGCTI